MKKMKQFLAIQAVVVLGLLAGCGKGGKGIVEAGIDEVGKSESVCKERNILLGWMRQECEFDLL